MDREFLLDMTEEIADIGRTRPGRYELGKVDPLTKYFHSDNEINGSRLDDGDGKHTGREIISRYLLLNVVLDQGPDVGGIDYLIREVTNELYGNGIDFLHCPEKFFVNLNKVIDTISLYHEVAKEKFSQDWARRTGGRPDRYCLYFAQSMRGIISIGQVLDYTVHRWGVPLGAYSSLTRNSDEMEGQEEPLVEYLDSYGSAEIMSREIKSNHRYGFGSAIGNKACHLFAKNYVSTFELSRNIRETENTGWTGLSYEVPFDSNIGRVLFRTGYLLEFASLEDLEDRSVIQKRKGEPHYIRVTNLREMKTSSISSIDEEFKNYITLVRDYLKTGSRPRKVNIQHTPSLLIWELNRNDNDLSIADFDDGLMYVGTNYCHNNEKPNCGECPLSRFCVGYRSKNDLIQDYRT